jgi:hypothetical protein
MQRVFQILVASLLLITSQEAEAGGRLFFRQSNVCVTPQTVVNSTFVPTYAVNVQAVAAVPLATVPVALDVQAYQYRVNSEAFSNYREYMEQKYASQKTGQVSTQQSTNLSAETVNAIAKEVLELMKSKGIIHEESTGSFIAEQANLGEKLQGASLLMQKCMTCHQAGNDPKKGFSMFDEQGNLYKELPYGKIASRVTTKDKTLQMPPDQPLSLEEQVQIQKLAIPAGEKAYNPFESQPEIAKKD